MGRSSSPSTSRSDEAHTTINAVMPWLDPGIHVFRNLQLGVDGRDKPGHDAEKYEVPDMIPGELFIKDGKLVDLDGHDDMLQFQQAAE